MFQNWTRKLTGAGVAVWIIINLVLLFKGKWDIIGNPGYLTTDFGCLIGLIGTAAIKSNRDKKIANSQ